MHPRPPEIPDLEAELRELLRQVPAGRVTTYGALARALGDVAAARWVGEYLVDHPHDDACPCHRVVRSTGELGLYITRDDRAKRKRLIDDGVSVDGHRVELSRFGFEDFNGPAPLARLRKFQESLPDRVQLTPLNSVPDVVGAVDVSYGDGEAVAAFVLVSTGTGELLWSTTCRDVVRFPYIPGFLAFREIPLHLRLLQRVRVADRLPPLLFVDGNGRLHRRRAGIATHLGVLADLPTIGIGKKLLCGTVDLEGLQPGEFRPVVFEQEPVGMALRAGPSSKPIFASPGQKIDVRSAAEIARRCFHGHRVPEPIYWADRVSRQAAAEVRRA